MAIPVPAMSVGKFVVPPRRSAARVSGEASCEGLLGRGDLAVGVVLAALGVVGGALRVGGRTLGVERAGVGVALGALGDGGGVEEALDQDTVLLGDGVQQRGAVQVGLRGLRAQQRTQRVELPALVGGAGDLVDLAEGDVALGAGGVGDLAGGVGLAAGAVGLPPADPELLLRVQRRLRGVGRAGVGLGEGRDGVGGSGRDDGIGRGGPRGPGPEPCPDPSRATTAMTTTATGRRAASAAIRGAGRHHGVVGSSLRCPAQPRPRTLRPTLTGRPGTGRLGPRRPPSGVHRAVLGQRWVRGL